MKPDWFEDFELDGKEGPARHVDASKAKVLASAIVRRALPAGAGDAARVEGSFTGRTRLLAIVGAASVVVASGLLHFTRSHEAPCPDETCAHVATVPSAAVSPMTISGVVDSSPASPASPASAAVSVTALPDAVSVKATEPAPRASTKTSEPAVAPAKSPSDLLAEANRARGAREWGRAAALYERVSRLPADESYAATVALASLRFEQFGDARSALRLYERALSTHPDGELSAQARVGVERCHRALEAEEHSAQ